MALLKIKCTNNECFLKSPIPVRLTVGKVYEADSVKIIEDQPMYQLIDDQGRRGWYLTSRFEEEDNGQASVHERLSVHSLSVA